MHSRFPTVVTAMLMACAPQDLERAAESLDTDGEVPAAQDSVVRSDGESGPSSRPGGPAGLQGGTVSAYEVGALIIPMDTTYQDEGMLRAFGLVYDLLSNGIPVQWVIEPGKGLGDPDFTTDAVALQAGVPTGSSFTHGYRAGPWVVRATDAADALPIVATWQGTYPETAVHQATQPFTGSVARDLVAAPSIAMFADGNEKIARGYVEAAGIPDSVGDLTWPDESPDMLDVGEVSGPTTNTPHDDGALFDEDGDPVYCQLMSMHWGVNDAEDDPEVVAEVRQYLNHAVHFFAECQAVNAFENLDPHGYFLTPDGFDIGDRPDGVDFYNVDQPFVQIDGSWDTVGGSEPAYSPIGGAYKAGDIVLVTEQGTPETVNDVWMTGYLDGLCPPSAEECFGVGKVSYLGGHSYSTDTPISENPDSQGTRMFLNSLFEAPCATAVDVATVVVNKSGPAFTASAQVTYTINYFNPSVSTALDVTITDTLPAGSTYVDSCCGGTEDSGVVSWDVGNLGSNESGSVTVTVAFPGYGSYDNVAGADFKAGVTPFESTSNTVTTVYGAPSCSDGFLNQDESDVDCGGTVCEPCSAGGSCVGDADCDSAVCTGGVCQAPTCSDGVVNQDETDVDCGGTSCPDCPDGGGCSVAADCVSGVCTGNVCQAPTCSDGVLNQDETRVDCGGSVCAACGTGGGCSTDADCVSGVCQGNVCQAPTCSDGVLNQDETDIDCGGSSCPACDDGSACSVGSDCDSNVCTGNVCQAPTCNDGVMNQDETRVDCGGSICPSCGNGGGCITAADCASGVCTGNVCQAPTCSDGVMNQDETRVDCGGSVCQPCGIGQNCDTGADCDSGVCSGNVCQAPTCSDGVMNQDETGLDCGGSTCPACGDGQGCLVPADCTSGVCTDNVCAATACDDGIQNGNETDVDCGGIDCPACDDGGACSADDDCTSGVCSGDVCQAPACDDGVHNQDETAVDCGGAVCNPCSIPGSGCLADEDCESGVCVDGTCAAPSCEDGEQNQGETDVDCGGATCDACGSGDGCAEAGDCASGVCTGGACAAASCDDGVLNQDEDDVDCGGPNCAECDDTSDPPDDGGSSGGDGDPDQPEPGSGGSDSGTSGAGDDTAGGGSGGEEPVAPTDSDSSGGSPIQAGPDTGCGCQTTDRRPPAAGLCVLGLLAFRRRRRAA